MSQGAREEVFGKIRQHCDRPCERKRLIQSQRTEEGLAGEREEREREETTTEHPAADAVAAAAGSS